MALPLVVIDNVIIVIELTFMERFLPISIIS